MYSNHLNTTMQSLDFLENLKVANFKLHLENHNTKEKITYHFKTTKYA